MKCTPWILIFLCQAASLRAACAAHMRSPTEEAATDRLLNIRDTHGEEMFYFDIPEIKHLPKTLRHRSERTLHTVQSQTHGRTTAVNATPQIIGGTNAKEGQYPYFASVAPSSHWLCGASLVAPDMLLTAGHCAEAFKKGAIVKAMVEASTKAGGVAVKVTKQILYPGWTSFEHDDLLFLEIDPPIFDVDPLQLNFETTLPVNGESLEIIGFGKTGDLSGISPVSSKHKFPRFPMRRVLLIMAVLWFSHSIFVFGTFPPLPPLVRGILEDPCWEKEAVARRIPCCRLVSCPLACPDALLHPPYLPDSRGIKTFSPLAFVAIRGILQRI